MADESTDKLVRALELSSASAELLNDARANRYHDYKGESHSPITDLVMRLRREGLSELAERAVDGEFDATHEEAEEWARSPGGVAALAMLQKGSGRK